MSAVLALVGIVLLASMAAAQPTGDTGGVELPPAPEDVPPIMVGEVHVQVVLPVGDTALCPAGAACIFDSGGGIGGVVERRWPSGWGLQLAYDAWFMDGQGVYELGVMHFLRAGFRYLFRRNQLTHPYVGVGIGGLIFGDTFSAESFGAGLHLEVGTEVEITTTVAITTALTGRMFTATEFRTGNDGVERARGFDLNAAIAFQIGLAIFESQ